jgi:4-hydroxysphinganine ceramide fatty acyl 2-hydroxylase
MQSVSTEEPTVNEAPTATTAPLRPKHKGSAQLFQNPVLERLSHTHIALPVGIFALTGIISMYYGLTHGFMTGLAALGLFLVGLLAFTFVEYLVHRYVYHIPATTPGRAKFQYTMHGVHHEYPKDKTRLAMPPIITVFVASLLFFIFRFSFGSYAFGLLSGFPCTCLCTMPFTPTRRPRTSSKCGGRTTASTIIGKTRWLSA